LDEKMLFKEKALPLRAYMARQFLLGKLASPFVSLALCVQPSQTTKKAMTASKPIICRIISFRTSNGRFMTGELS
jgi:hypothetical protein